MNRPHSSWKLRFGPLWVGILAQGERVHGSTVGRTAQEVTDEKSAPAQATSPAEHSVRFQRTVEDILHGRQKVPLEWLKRHRLSPFQESVLRFTRNIPWGRTVSYGEVARRIGRPGSARAVGQALRANPLPVLIPCHRVIGSHGDLRGYGGPSGTPLKQALLDLEQQASEARPIVWSH